MTEAKARILGQNLAECEGRVIDTRDRAQEAGKRVTRALAEGWPTYSVLNATDSLHGALQDLQAAEEALRQWVDFPAKALARFTRQNGGR